VAAVPQQQRVNKYE